MKILCYPNQKLSIKCNPVRRYGNKLKEFTDELIKTMKSQRADGLAAPQVGVSKRVFVAMIDEEPTVFVNPKIISFDGDQIDTQEGCLSVPGIVANLKSRNNEIYIEAKDPMGEEIRMTLMDREAIIFQHELDHLDGTIIFDKMNRVQKMMKKKKYQTNAKKLARKLAKERK